MEDKPSIAEWFFWAWSTVQWNLYNIMWFISLKVEVVEFSGIQTWSWERNKTNHPGGWLLLGHVWRCSPFVLLYLSEIFDVINCVSLSATKRVGSWSTICSYISEKFQSRLHCFNGGITTFGDFPYSSTVKWNLLCQFCVRCRSMLITLITWGNAESLEVWRCENLDGAKQSESNLYQNGIASHPIHCQI